MKKQFTTAIDRILSKKSLSLQSESIPNQNASSGYEEGDKNTEGFDISQSHPDLAPGQHRHAPQLRFQSKSMSSGQLMAMAAKYATIAGDRVHPTALLRSLAASEQGESQEENSDSKNPSRPRSCSADHPVDVTNEDSSAPGTSLQDDNERTLLPHS